MNRQGAALYLVLMGLAALSVATTTLLRLSTQRSQALATERFAIQAEILRADAERAAWIWLKTKGPTLATSVELPYAATTVISSSVQHEGTDISITVEVWDAASGVPCLVEDHTLGRDLLPSDVIPPTTTATSETWWLLAESTARARFPTSSLTEEDELRPPALALVASPWSAGRVNWRTAPWPVVEAILSARHHPELGTRLQSARRNGEDVAFPNDWVEISPPYLVGTADRWLLVTTLRWGEAERRWLTVLGLERQDLHCLARYAIP